MGNQQGSWLMIMRNRGFAFWQSQRDAIDEMYNKKMMSSVDIAKHYGVYGSTILTNMKKLGIPIRKIGGSERPNALHSLDSSYFDRIDNANKAYTLGFITSDGHISTSNAVMFAQSSTELDVLEKIRAELKSNHPIRNKNESAYTFSFTSKHICDKLRDMGLNNRKSYGFDFSRLRSYIPTEYERDFVRGLFDGDGSIRIYKYDYFPKHTYHLGFTGIKETCEYVRSMFDLHTKMADEGNGIFTVVSSCRSDIVRIGHLMYDNATIYMNRKKQTFDKVYALIQAES